jgi:hypothetical protein
MNLVLKLSEGTYVLLLHIILLVTYLAVYYILCDHGVPLLSSHRSVVL